MAVTSFVGVQWQPLDIIDETKMRRMSDNIQYVHDNTPRTLWNAGKANARKQGIKIISGRGTIAKAPKKSNARVTVGFGNFFSPGCQPQITTGIMSPVQQNIFCTFRGRNRLEPDHNGVILEIEIGEKDKEKSRIARTFAVHYIAMGY